MEQNDLIVELHVGLYHLQTQAQPSFLHKNLQAFSMIRTAKHGAADDIRVFAAQLSLLNQIIEESGSMKNIRLSNTVEALRFYKAFCMGRNTHCRKLRPLQRIKTFLTFFKMPVEHILRLYSLLHVPCYRYKNLQNIANVLSNKPTLYFVPTAQNMSCPVVLYGSSP